MNKLFLFSTLVVLSSLSNVTNAGLLGDVFGGPDEEVVVVENRSDRNQPHTNERRVVERRYHHHRLILPDTEYVEVVEQY